MKEFRKIRGLDQFELDENDFCCHLVKKEKNGSLVLKFDEFCLVAPGWRR